MRARIGAAMPLIGAEEMAGVERVIRSGTLAQGPEVDAFEGEFAAQVVGGRQCVALSSGTSGLHLGLVAAGIGPGDEVIVPSFTFAATANAVVLAGATPVFADIGPTDFCLSARSVEEHVTERTAAVLPVRLYGHPAECHPSRGWLHAMAYGCSRTPPRHTAPPGAAPRWGASENSPCSRSTRRGRWATTRA